jgi:L-arabinonolactonase
MIQQTIDLTGLFHGASLPPPAENDDGATCDFVTAVLVLDCHNLLGEGIIYDDRTSTVMWTDILSSNFHTLLLNYDHPTSALHTVYDLPKKLASFGLIDRHPTNSKSDHHQIELPILCAWEDGFQLYDIHQQKELSAMSIGEDVNPSNGLTRLNDGRVDPTGCHFICGGYYGDTRGITMKVYRVQQKSDDFSSSLQHEPIIDSIEVTNSICWSIDGKIMYLADSPQREIYAYDYDATTGKIANKTAFHCKLTTEVGSPDGSCVDAEGYLWNAVWKSGIEPSCVQRIDPNTGLVTFTVHMPDATSQVSCCCFGGENMDVLFITTACESRDITNEPHAGGLYAVRLPFRGRKESKLHFTIPSSC